MTRRIEGRLLVATHNAGKIREIRELLEPYGVSVTSAGERGLPEPAETGYMFSQNAALKAHAAAKATGLPSLADDSGICVDVLDGAPGLHTAEWAGEPGMPRDYGKAMRAIHAEVSRRGGWKDGTRAHFVSAMVLAWPDGHEELFEGRVHGTLAWPPRGDAGFGFDPIFVPDGHDRTFSEMTSEEKHGGATPLSHRSRAFAAFAAACLA